MKYPASSSPYSSSSSSSSASSSTTTTTTSTSSTSSIASSSPSSATETPSYGSNTGHIRSSREVEGHVSSRSGRENTESGTIVESIERDELSPTSTS
ncbi:hypothetical protein K432DRAFT_336832 [Lepidopterella palustris CBS 459.81]|uniref:Uncharacterized protein n=1 Tax=Lepidopterella palustris CBS 459.81 TaxID=1314670 RepID=A0A8E2E1R1_9PEZI|nr:hypothetical protein K432DRAFT_336832 [Lepidopterella palustris CBS 459.81]